MGKNINDLGLKKTAINVPDEIPEERGGFAPPPYPGSYRFRLPGDMSHLWDKLDAGVGERVSMVFDDENPLEITQAKNPDYVGQTLRVRINNVERNRAKKNEPEVLVSDMTYIIRALSQPNPPPKLKANEDFIAAMKKFGGREFGSDLEWTTNCSEKRAIRVEVVDQATGDRSFETGRNEDGTEKMGCGTRYYMNDWPKQDGKYADSITCQCGANLMPFPQLRNFKAVPPTTTAK